MAQSQLSSLGIPVVVNEDQVDFSQFRAMFLFITAMVGIYNIYSIIQMYKQTKVDHIDRDILTRTSSTGNYAILRTHSFVKNNQRALKAITITYILHACIHTFHYIDNIIRPVDYHEPMWLYRRYFLSEMEITFWFNFPHVYFGIQFMKGLFDSGYVDYFYLIPFIYSALMTIMHYNVEVPAAYSFVVNMSIAGEGLSIVFLIAIAFVIKQKPENPESIRNKLIILSILAVCTGMIVITTLGLSSWSFAILLVLAVVVTKILEIFSVLVAPTEMKEDVIV